VKEKQKLILLIEINVTCDKTSETAKELVECQIR